MRFKNKIGVLGGSFDPAHVGHLAISKKAVKEYKLKKIIWAITLKNPLKKKNNSSISERIQSCKKIIKLNNFIKIKFYEKIIRSNKTIDLINQTIINHADLGGMVIFTSHLDPNINNLENLNLEFYE